jgi:uncharacterized protein YjbI with pentapeptide repeats
MANPEHLKILMQGVEVWNRWRNENPDVEPNLSKADFAKAYLFDANLSDANLSGANLSGANLSKACFESANLSKTNLSGANISNGIFSPSTVFYNIDPTFSLKKIGPNIKGKNLEVNLADFPVDIFFNPSCAILAETDLSNSNLSGAILLEATLQNVNLSMANLSGANLSRARLLNCNLSGASLSHTNLTSTNISGSNLERTILFFTIIGNVNLRDVKNIEKAIHYGPSHIDLLTIYGSDENLPKSFLRGCGVPENFIQYMSSLTGKAFDFYSCFISYSSKDQAFAERLYSDLQNIGVRWSEPFRLHT